MPELLPADRLAALGAKDLAAAIKPLFEDSAWLAGRLAGRYVNGWDELIDACEVVLREATDAEKAQVLQSHPRLGAPRAELKERSETSWREQGADRNPGGAVLGALAAANERYETHFGFPFVDWVGGRPLEEMAGVIDSCLASDAESELARGCRALVAIARDRLQKIAGETRCL